MFLYSYKCANYTFIYFSPLLKLLIYRAILLITIGLVLKHLLKKLVYSFNFVT